MDRGDIMEKKKRSKVNKIIKFIPLIVMAILFIYFALNYEDISVEKILNYTPSNYFLAAIIFLVFFAVKSISIVIPLSLIYISSSLVFPWYIAIIINFLGLFITMTIAFYIGKFSGKDMVDQMIDKYPKINIINKVRAENEWVSVFIVKILGFIPNDISSMVLGSFNTGYKAFIIASLLAKSPMMIAKTLIGSSIGGEGGRGLVIALFIAILYIIFTLFIYWKNKETIRT